jgi:hypothetical protein
MEVIVAILVLTTIVIIGFFWSEIKQFILKKLHHNRKGAE